MIPVLIAGALGLAAGEILITVRRRTKRRETWARAKACSRQTGKPLLVIGDPDASIHRTRGRDYGCGSGTMDPSGAPGCDPGIPARWNMDGPIRPLHGTAETILPRMPTGSAVIFVSCVLEYVDDLELVWSELHRVSGGDLYIVLIEPHALVMSGISPVYPHKAKWRIKKIEGMTMIASKV